MDENFTPDTLRACFADCEDDVLLPGQLSLVSGGRAAKRFAAAWEADRKQIAAAAEAFRQRGIAYGASGDELEYARDLAEHWEKEFFRLGKGE